MWSSFESWSGSLMTVTFFAADHLHSSTDKFMKLMRADARGKTIGS